MVDFWDVFLPAFAALFLITALKEAFQFGIYKWHQGRQAQVQKELEEKIGDMITRGELPSPEAMGGLFPMGMAPPFGPGSFPPTISGEQDQIGNKSHSPAPGQYI